MELPRHTTSALQLNRLLPGTFLFPMGTNQYTAVPPALALQLGRPLACARLERALMPMALPMGLRDFEFVRQGNFPPQVRLVLFAQPVRERILLRRLKELLVLNAAIVSPGSTLSVLLILDAKIAQLALERILLRRIKEQLLAYAAVVLLGNTH